MQSQANVIDVVNREMHVATDMDRSAGARIAAIRRLEDVCHDTFAAPLCQAALSETHHINEMLVLLLERNEDICTTAFKLVRTVTTTNDFHVRELIGKRLMEDLLELLGSGVSSHGMLEDLLTIVANLLESNSCRMELERATLKKAPGGIKAFIGYLDSRTPKVQLAALKALNAMAQIKSGRAIIASESVLPVVGLCFVDTLYGEIKYYAVKLLASLSKQAEVRKIIGQKGVVFRLTQTVVNGAQDPLLSQLLASIYCNFTTSQDVEDVEPAKIFVMIYSLICSNQMDDVIQGLWALANSLTSPVLRRELIETDGLKIVFSILRLSDGEPQIWYETGRIIAAVAGGGAVGKGVHSDEEQEYLVREGAVEALVAIYQWCIDGSCMPRASAPDDEGDVSQALFDSDGNNVASSTHFMCMSVCTRALRYLTTRAHVCHLLSELKGLRALVQVLKADWDTEAQEHASCAIANIVLISEPCHELVTRHEVVPSLIDLVRNSTHDLIHKEAANALGNLCAIGGQYLREIINAGGTMALIGVLQREHCTVATATHVIRALGLLDTNDAKIEMLSGGGLKHIMRFVVTECAALRRVCAIAIRSLSEVPEDAWRIMMVGDGAMEALVFLLADDDISTIRESARAVAMLTQLESNKTSCTGEGINAVVGHLANTDRELCMSILSIIGNVCTVTEVVESIPHLDTVIRQICYVLQMNAFSLTLQATRCLVSLTKLTRCTATVLATIPASVFIEMTLSHHATLQMHAVNVVTNLAMDPNNWKALREAQVSQVLSSLFSSDSFDVILQAVQCMGYIVADPICQEEILSDGLLISMLVDVAKKAGDVAISPDPNMPGFVASRNLQMLERVLGAIKQFANTEEGARGLVEVYCCLPLLLECIDCSTLEVRNEATGCLAMLAEHPEQCAAIVEDGGVEKVVQALRAATAHLAEMEGDIAVISKRLGVNKLLEMKQQDDEDEEDEKMFDLFEQREELVHSMNQQLQLSKQTLQTQVSCLKLLGCVALASHHRKVSLLEAYDWPVFIVPLASRDSRCQQTAALLAFDLLRANLNLQVFIEMGGVSYLLHSLESENQTVKELAAAGISQLSAAHPDLFRHSIVQEGGVKRVMELTDSTIPTIRAQAYSGIAELAQHAVLAMELVSQGVLHALRQYSSKSKYRPDSQKLILHIVGVLVAHKELSQTVLEKGGAFLLFQALSHFDTAVVTAAATELRNIIDRAPDSSEALCRCKLALNVVEGVKKAFSPDVLTDLLKILTYMCSLQSFRERVAKSELVDTLLRLTSDSDRQREMASRCAAAEIQKNLTIKEATARRMSMAPDIDSTAFGPNKVSKRLFENVAAAAVGCLTCLLPVNGIVEYVSSNEETLMRVVGAATEKSSAERIHSTVTVLNAIIEVPATHAACIEAGIIAKLADFALKVHQDDTRLLIAQAFEMLTRSSSRTAAKASNAPKKGKAVAQPDDLFTKHFTPHKVCNGVVALLNSTVAEVRISMCNVLKSVMEHQSRELLRCGAVIGILPFLDSDKELLQLQVLAIIQKSCTEFKLWFEDTSLGLAQYARDNCNPAIGRIMDVYRRSPQRSKCSMIALITLHVVLSAAPKYLCNLIDSAMILDLKKAATQIPRVRGSPPTLTYGKSNIDCQKFVDEKGEVPNMDHSEVKIQATRLLFYMTNQAEGAGHLVTVMKVLNIDDMLKSVTSAFMDGYDERFLILMLRIAARAVQRSNHKMIIAEDKTGLLKNLFALTTHKSPLVIQPAIYIIARVSEEAGALSRVLAMSSVQGLANMVLSLIDSLLSIDALAPGTTRRFNTGMQSVVMQTIADFCALISNLSDGVGANFMRSLKEAGDTLNQALLSLPRQSTLEAKFHLMSAIAVLDGSHPQAVAGVMLPPDEYIEAAQSKIDNTRVQSGVLSLCTLARDSACHEELVEYGAVAAVCGVMKNPTPAIFRGACWCLNLLLLGCRDPTEHRDKPAKERTKLTEKRAASLNAVAAMICEEGITAAGKVAIGHGNAENTRAAGKLLSLLLRFPACREYVQQITSSPLLPPMC